MYIEDNHILRIENIIERESSFMLNNPNISAVGLGVKKINGVSTDVPALSFIVKEKISMNSIPKEFRIPQWIGGVLTDVIETSGGATIVGGNPKVKVGDPAVGGDKISRENDEGVGGVIAYAVTEKKYGIQLYFLSPQHVLAKDVTTINGNLKTKVFFPEFKISKGNDQAKVAYYNKGVAIKLGKPLLGAAYNEVDAAVANITTNSPNQKKVTMKIGIKLAGKIERIKVGKDPVKADEQIFIIDPITDTKSMGVVELVKATVKVNFQGKETNFKNQIVTSGYFKPGFSGALGIRASNNEAIGMLMSGERGLFEASDKRYFNDLNKVLDLLEVEFATEENSFEQ